MGAEGLVVPEVRSPSGPRLRASRPPALPVGCLGRGGDVERRPPLSVTDRLPDSLPEGIQICAHRQPVEIRRQAALDVDRPTVAHLVPGAGVDNPESGVSHLNVRLQLRRNPIDRQQNHIPDLGIPTPLPFHFPRALTSDSDLMFGVSLSKDSCRSNNSHAAESAATRVFMARVPSRGLKIFSARLVLGA